MKYNLLVLLADLFNLFEIHPAKAVCYPEMEQFGKFSHYFVDFCSTSFSVVSNNNI